MQLQWPPLLSTLILAWQQDGARLSTDFMAVHLVQHVKALNSVLFLLLQAEHSGANCDWRPDGGQLCPSPSAFSVCFPKSSHCGHSQGFLSAVKLIQHPHQLSYLFGCSCNTAGLEAPWPPSCFHIEEVGTKPQRDLEMLIH